MQTLRNAACFRTVLDSRPTIAKFGVLLAAILLVWAALLQPGSVLAAPIQSNDGSVILRMCKGAEKVRALSVMCHSYLNGYIDAAHYFGKGKTHFCLEAGDKEQVPGVLVAWLDSHPESLNQPAGAVLQTVLSARFACKGKK